MPNSQLRAGCGAVKRAGAVALGMLLVMGFEVVGYSASVAMAHPDYLPTVITRLFAPVGQGPMASVRCVALAKRLTLPGPGAAASTGFAKQPPQETYEQGYAYVGPGFGRYVYELQQALSSRDYAGLATLMHPRLQATSQAVAQAMGSLKVAPRTPAALHQLWAVYSHDYASVDADCDDEDIILSSLYGYQMQVFGWFALADGKEIARVMVSIVPVAGELYLGLMRAHMWTHHGKTPMEWVAEADQELAQNHTLSAYVKYKAAQMLLDGGTYYRLPLQEQIKEFLVSRQASAVWQTEVARQISPQAEAQLVRATPLLTVGGAGMYLRFALDKEWSSQQIRAHCGQVLAGFEQLAAMAHLTGIRCGYYLPFETDYTIDSMLGGLYVAKGTAAKSK